MSSEQPKKPSDSPMNEALQTMRSSIKSTVAASNRTLASLHDTTESIRKPIDSAVATAKEQAIVVQHLVQRRHEFAPEIIAGSTLVGAGLFGLRRGRVAGLVGGVTFGAAAYGAVYANLDWEHIPDLMRDYFNGEAKK